MSIRLKIIVSLACLWSVATVAMVASAHTVSPDIGLALMPENLPWQVVDRSGNAIRKYRIPDELPEIASLPIDQRIRLRALVNEHQLSHRFVRKAIKATQGAVRGGRMHAKPEYRASLSEIVIGVDRGARSDDPLYAHEPVLRALPAYTRIDVMTPAAFASQVKESLKRLHLESRSRIIVNPKPPEDKGATRWVRDTFLVADDGKQQTLFHSLGYQPRRDVSVNDLRYLEFMRGANRQVVRAPLFYRAGNFLLGVQSERILFVGADELAGNREVYEHAIGHVPGTEAVLEVFAALTGADEVVVMPNTRRLFHVDMYMSFIDDGVVALLDPLDPDALSFEDRSVLYRARKLLTERGFRVVPVPTVAARIARYQSSTNIVPFRHRETGIRMALVPDFADVRVFSNGHDASLNAMVNKAWRDAGVVPVFVEDRFYPDQGNTHCAVVPLR